MTYALIGLYSIMENYSHTHILHGNQPCGFNGKWLQHEKYKQSGINERLKLAKSNV